jgi:hypothetical protein
MGIVKKHNNYVDVGLLNYIFVFLDIVDATGGCSVTVCLVRG